MVWIISHPLVELKMGEGEKGQKDMVNFQGTLDIPKNQKKMKIRLMGRGWMLEGKAWRIFNLVPYPFALWGPLLYNFLLSPLKEDEKVYIRTLVGGHIYLSINGINIYIDEHTWKKIKAIGYGLVSLWEWERSMWIVKWGNL